MTTTLLNTQITSSGPRGIPVRRWVEEPGLRPPDSDEVIGFGNSQIPFFGGRGRASTESATDYLLEFEAYRRAAQERAREREAAQLPSLTMDEVAGLASEYDQAEKREGGSASSTSAPEIDSDDPCPGSLCMIEANDYCEECHGRASCADVAGELAAEAQDRAAPTQPRVPTFDEFLRGERFPEPWSDRRDLAVLGSDTLRLAADIAANDVRIGATIREVDRARDRRRGLRGATRSRRSCVSEGGDASDGDGGGR